jgi:hypothetical protein
MGRPFREVAVLSCANADIAVTGVRAGVTFDDAFNPMLQARFEE